MMATFGDTLPMLRNCKVRIDLNGKLGGSVTPVFLTRLRSLAFLALSWIAWVNTAGGTPAEPLNAPKKTVLVLYCDPLSAPADRMTEQGLTAALSSTPARDLEVFSEYLDLVRFPAPRYGDDLVRYLRARYGTRKPDV